MKKRILSVLVAGLLSSASLFAFAQADDAMSHAGHHRWDPAKMEQLHAKHLAELKSKLKLTPEQEGAWTTFSSAMKPPAHSAKRPDFAALDKLSTPERIDQMHALRKEHIAAMDSAMDQREEATKTFYAALNADQKKTFDTEHSRHAHKMHDGMSGANKANPVAKP
jgi:Spy/CpxP family protein refolding chaperone